MTKIEKTLIVEKCEKIIKELTSFVLEKTNQKQVDTPFSYLIWPIRNMIFSLEGLKNNQTMIPDSNDFASISRSFYVLFYYGILEAFDFLKISKRSHSDQENFQNDLEKFVNLLDEDQKEEHKSFFHLSKILRHKGGHWGQRQIKEEIKKLSIPNLEEKISFDKEGDFTGIDIDYTITIIGKVFKAFEAAIKKKLDQLKNQGKSL